MSTKSKILSMAALATLAATIAVRAATPAPVTSATVWNDVTVQFTVFAQDNPYLSTNKNGTAISAKTTQSAFTTTTLLDAVAADTGEGFDPATSKLVVAKSYAYTNVYTVVSSNATTGVLTTNYYDETNFAGLSNASPYLVTIATNSVFTNQPTTQLEVVDLPGNVYPLTNGHYSFSFTAYTANLTEKAMGGVPITGTTAGTEYGIGALMVNSPSNWVINSISGYGTATITSKNLQTAKNPLYVDTRSSSSAVAGAGIMGGTVTNGVATNYTHVVVKGTLTETFWKVLLNQ